VQTFTTFTALALMKKKTVSILTHTAGWLAFFLLPPLFLNLYLLFSGIKMPQSAPGGAQVPVMLIAAVLVFTTGPFYLNRYLFLPKLLGSGKKAVYFTASIAVMFTVIFAMSFVQKQYSVQPPPGIPFSPPRPLRGIISIIMGLLQFTIVWFFSSILYMAHRNKRIEQKNEEMKVQKLDAELLYLKAQINPHFLFNTLNNIYALSICDSEQTPEAILKLSAIMRYVTQEAAAETVPLEKELEYISSYISLQQLRSNHNLAVKYTFSGNATTYRIAPLILINFIENAFKHGVSNHAPCFVYIDIQADEGYLLMHVSNRKFAKEGNAAAASGISNTIRRLQLQYPGKYQYSVDDNHDLYKVTLQLNLA
jgi:two-component system, LytTR family, sensor kinase